jgi:hypothetical protein
VAQLAWFGQSLFGTTNLLDRWHPMCIDEYLKDQKVVYEALEK